MTWTKSNHFPNSRIHPFIDQYSTESVSYRTAKVYAFLQVLYHIWNIENHKLSSKINRRAFDWCMFSSTYLPITKLFLTISLLSSFNKSLTIPVSMQSPFPRHRLDLSSVLRLSKTVWWPHSHFWHIVSIPNQQKNILIKVKLLNSQLA